MPDPRDDLIRRGDVLARITNQAETPGDDWSIVTRREIDALPADPVAAAAVALAEAADAWQCASRIAAVANRKSAEDVFSVTKCLAAYERGAETVRARAAMMDALAAYRAALAGRERGR